MSEAKGLTPQEFEDRYLAGQEAKNESEKGVGISRNMVRSVLDEPDKVRRVFELSEGYEGRVQEYYDAAFDKAFEGIKDIPFPKETDYALAKLELEKALKAEGLVWARMAVDHQKNLKLDYKGDNPKGVMVVYRPDHESDGESQQLCVFSDHEKGPPVIMLLPKALSWKMAAINLVGGVSRCIYSRSGFNRGATLDEERRKFLQDVYAADVQILLADHLTGAVFTGHIGRWMKQYLMAERIEEFAAQPEKRLREWGLGLTSFAFGRMNPPLSGSEQMARVWLSKMAALRAFAHEQVGNRANEAEKLGRFALLYKSYADKLGVRYER